MSGLSVGSDRGASPQGIFPRPWFCLARAPIRLLCVLRTGGWFDTVGVNDLTLEETRKVGSVSHLDS